ncbi:MAG TPA: sensor histidine kinase [Pseudonocardiaceae bacterium]|nr:sensor histidine kinase [Pseudonocardiaceae bacterium]
MGPQLTMPQDRPTLGADETIPGAAAPRDSAPGWQPVPVSDETLLLVREEERRRLLFELHDRVGPTLASMALGLRAARRALEVNPEVAAQLLAELELDVRRGVTELRALTRGQAATGSRGLGLLTTLRRHVGTLAARTAGSLDVTLDLPSALPPLPAAVEVAVYRVTCEALTNVIRHADARHCTLRLWLDTSEDDKPRLHLEVEDDGTGLDATDTLGVGLDATDTLGVGLRSMAERARELGGEFRAETVANGRGTLVVVRLPCGSGGA